MPRAKNITRHQRLKRQQWLLGIVCTLMVMVAWRVGMLERLELPTVDWRTRWFNRWSAGPAPEVVVMGIGDAATDPRRGVGRWPWSREVMAEAITELRLAGAKTIALDVLLESPEAAESADGGVGGPDAALAEAIRLHGGVVLPMRSRISSPTGEEPVTAFALAMNLNVRGTLAGRSDEVAAVLIAEYLAPVDGQRRADLRAEVARVLPAVRSLLAMEGRSTIEAGDAAVDLPGVANDLELPVPELVSSAAMLGDVTINSSFDQDNVLRRLPLWTRLEGGEDRLWPSFSLAAVAAYLDTPVSEIGLAGGAIDVGSNSARGIRVGHSGEGEYMWPVTWPRGGESWAGQFDSSGAPREVSVLVAMEPFLIRRAVRRNLEVLQNLLVLAEGLNLGEYGEAIKSVGELREVPFETTEWQRGIVEVAAAVAPAAAEAADFVEFAGDVDVGTLPVEDAEVYLNYRRVADGIPAIVEECRGARGRIDAARTRLEGIVDGRLVFIGWVASGAVADAVSTSLVHLTPGVYIHAAAASSFLSGFVRTAPPVWIDGAFVVLLGVSGIMAARRVSVWAAPLLLALVLGAWFALAGIVLWDAMWMRAVVAAPAVAACTSWLGVVLHRLLVEQRMRRRTEERFRAYVSPAVVDELVNNPQLDSMTPRRRELAIMFCDVTGFTSIAERLGAEGTARFLTGYLGKMTDTLLRHNATIDKYLGDGIMAFWGAPLPDPRHSRNACRAAISLVRAVADLNPPDPRPGDPAHLAIRIGLAAGDVMVGDFGNPPVRSSYTVLGDACNIAARLERACKLLGTTILASATVRAQAGEGFIWRPLGVFILHGRLAPEPIFELLGMTASGSRAAADETLAISPLPGGDWQESGAGVMTGPRVTPETVGEWVRATEEAVEAFAGKRYEEARERFVALERDFGDTSLARVYLPAIDRRVSGDALDEPVDAVRLTVS